MYTLGALWYWALRESILPLFDTFSPVFQILTVTAPSGVLVTHVTQGPSQYLATCKGKDNLYLLCQLLWRPLPCGSWDFPGGVGKGVGTKENVPLGRAGSKETGQEVGLGNKFMLDT